MSRRTQDTPEPITIAFAGHGDIDLENVKGLLGDFLGLGDEDPDGFPELPDHDITLIFPLTKDHLSDGLDAVLDWTAYAGLDYQVVTTKEKHRAIDKVIKDADDTEFVTNVTDATVERLAEAEGKAFVVLLWGDEGSPEAELLLDAAAQKGIPAKDLTAGLDDISFSQDDAPEPEEPTVEPEPEPTPRRGRRGRGRQAEQEATPDETPLTEDDVKEPEPPAAKPRRTRASKPAAENPVEQDIEEQKALPKAGAPAKTEEPKQLTDDLENRFGFHPAAANTGPLHTDVRMLALTFARELELFLPEGREKSVALMRIEEAMFWANAAIARNGAPLETAVRATSTPEKAQDEPEEEEVAAPVRKRRGRPRDEEKTWAFLEDEDGNLTRRGRGRIPAGSKVVSLTRAEMEERGLDTE